MLGAEESEQRHFVHLNHVESWKGHASSLMSATNYNLAFAMKTGVAYHLEMHASNFSILNISKVYNVLFELLSHLM